MRRICNWLFVGSEQGGERTAIILTIVASAHRHDLDVWAYLRDVLERLAKGEDDLEELLPDVWKANHPQHVPFDGHELYDRGPDRVGTHGTAEGKNTALRPAPVAPRMLTQLVAAGTVEMKQNQDPLAWLEALQAPRQRRV